jgi:polysaccharide chain length determinant protein (PEP-CTERM system associated)
MMNWTPAQLLRLTLAELSRLRVFTVVSFIVISLVTIVAGMVMPKNYSSSATVLAERREILTPLMEGSAVDTANLANDDERIRFYRELLFSREIMARVIREIGLVATDSKDVALEERTIQQLMERTALEATGPNLVRISVNDQSASRSHDTARLFSELLVSESESEKTRESTAAFAFIDSQARGYHDKLIEAEQRLTQYRGENVDVGTGTESAISERISFLQTDVERNSLGLREARTRVQSLESQLNGQSQVVVRDTRVSQYRSQIASLQEQIDVLRLRYTDTYPDIVNLKYQIIDLEKALSRELSAGSRPIPSGSSQSSSSASMANPLWLRLRQQLSEATTEVAALESRLWENERLLANALVRAKRVPEVEATMAELTRDHEVNNTVYQDLLRRRENARVSMNMDLEQSGGNFRVLYAATEPVSPDGLRLLHFALIGPLLGLLFPLGFILASLELDSRIRHENQIVEEFGFDVIGEVGVLLTQGEQARHRLVTVALGLGVVGVFAIYAYIAWLGTVARTMIVA